MEGKCAIEELFNAIKTSHQERAMGLLEKAKEEVDLVSKVEHINAAGRESLKTILQMISQVSKNKMKEAKKSYEKAERQFSGHVKNYLMVGKQISIVRLLNTGL